MASPAETSGGLAKPALAFAFWQEGLASLEASSGLSLLTHLCRVDSPTSTFWTCPSPTEGVAR